MGTLRRLILPLLLGHFFFAHGAPVCEATRPEPWRQPEPSAAGTSRSAPSVPSWAADARWYHVVVPRFHNVDSTEGSGEGNLAGLAVRLGYLKELGINALLLDTIFHERSAGKHPAADLRHIDDRIGQRESLSRVIGETTDPGTWRFSESDRLFRSFVKTAHDHGFRVALAVDIERVVRGLAEPGDLPGYWLATTRRWSDPNADGNPSDGVDGWVVAGVERAPRGLWRIWRAQVKKLNRNVLLVADVDKDAQSWLGEGGFDVAINRETGATIRRFFASMPSTARLGKFVDDLVVASKSPSPGTRNASLTPMGGPGVVRLRTLLTKSLERSEKKTAVPATAGNDPSLARLRLATFLAQFSRGAPVTFYGDEVGMSYRQGVAEPAPMWWPDLRQQAMGNGAGYYARLASLIRWVGARRDVDKPLRRGRFEKVMVDEARRLFAVGRSLGSQRVILVMNLSDTKQKIMLKVGTPTQIVTLLSPHLLPAGARRPDETPRVPANVHVAPLGMLASAQRVSDAGEIRLWVDPMSVRLVLMGGDEPK